MAVPLVVPRFVDCIAPLLAHALWVLTLDAGPALFARISAFVVTSVIAGVACYVSDRSQRAHFLLDCKMRGLGARSRRISRALPHVRAFDLFAGDGTADAATCQCVCRGGGSDRH